MNTDMTFFEWRNQNSSFWYQKSVALYASASLLSEAMSEPEDKDFLKRLDLNTDFGVSIGCEEPYWMLFGLSYELMLKAICIRDDICFKKTHNILDLAKYADVELNDNEKTQLRLLSEFVVWQGRYPTPFKETVMKQQWNSMRKALWKDMYIGDIKFGKYRTNILDHIELKKLWKKLSNIYSQVV